MEINVVDMGTSKATGGKATASFEDTIDKYAKLMRIECVSGGYCGWLSQSIQPAGSLYLPVCGLGVSLPANAPFADDRARYHARIPTVPMLFGLRSTE